MCLIFSGWLSHAQLHVYNISNFDIFVMFSNNSIYENYQSEILFDEIYSFEASYILKGNVEHTKF